MEADSPLDWDLSEWQGATVVRPSGVLDLRTYGTLRDALLKCAADQPRAVIVDLEELAIAEEQLTSVFVAVWLRISQWSTVALVVVPGAAHAALARYGPMRRFVTVRPTVLDALAGLGDPPPRRRTELWLPSSPRSVAAAATFVTDTCTNWAIDALAAPAVTVAGELVANAAEHAHSPARLRLELRLGRLTTAVADDDGRPVSLPPVGERSPEPRSGLPLVTHLAHAAGWSPKQSGGKIVWAVLRPPRTRLPPMLDGDWARARDLPSRSPTILVSVPATMEVTYGPGCLPRSTLPGTVVFAGSLSRSVPSPRELREPATTPARLQERQSSASGVRFEPMRPVYATPATYSPGAHWPL
jgi:hypothetical protein